MHRADTIARLQALFDGQAEDRICARMQMPLPPERAERIARMAQDVPADEFPKAENLFPIWEEYLGFFEPIEHDWLPSIYPRQFDQGIYGAVLGAPIVVDPVDGPGWVCSMTAPIEGATYAQMAARCAEPDAAWIQRLDEAMRTFARLNDGRFGIAVAIPCDALNLAMQIFGSRPLLDLNEDPEGLKAFMQEGVRLSIRLVECQRAAIGAVGREDGVFDFFNAGWMPEQGVPMSVDCYNFCRPEIYAEFGRPYHQQLIDHFGGGNFHVHGNGRHVLPEVAKLRGCVVIAVGDDGSPTKAIDEIEALKEQAGSAVLAVSCPAQTFRRRLGEKSLPGGAFYNVGGLESIDEANRLMESVRAYRV